MNAARTPCHRIALLLALCVQLCACGFSLRGEAVLPDSLKRTTLEVVDPFSPLTRDLTAALQRGGATIVQTGTADAGRIAIPTNAVGVEPLTVGAEARVREYLVRYSLSLQAFAADGTVLLAPTDIVLEREFSFDETQALGAQAQQELIIRELQREMVQQVLRRLEALR